MAGLFSKLFGRKAGDAANDLGVAETYNGYVIRPNPRQDGGQWYVAGTIVREGDADGEAHEFIRADTFTSLDDAVFHSLRKARQIIDEQGERLIPKA